MKKHPEFDRDGNRLIVPAGGTEPVPHTRATTVAGRPGDRAKLELYQQRNVAVGLALRPDLVAEALDSPSKWKLNRICAEAAQAAGASDKADRGTLVHSLAEQVDAGTLALEDVPDADRPTVKFDKVGDTADGDVVDFEVQQQRDIKTKEPKFYADGKPMLQLKVTLATDDRDPEIEDDDGHRAIYVKNQMKSAVSDACRAVGATSGIEIGGRLKVRWDSTEPAQTKGFNDKKVYKAKYTRPAPAAVSVDDF